MTENFHNQRERIRQTEEKFPIPQWDLDRLNGRLWVLRLLPQGGIGMEVGVFRGCFSEEICRIARPKKLYLVDPWTKLGETFGWGKEYTCFDTLTTLAARTETELRVSQYPETESVIIEGSFPDCKDQIAEPLDWAYLDASHKYDRTLWELNQLEKIIKPGGYILGDDWHPNPEHQHHGVYQAVQEFVAKSDWEIIKAGPGSQWAMRRASD